MAYDKSELTAYIEQNKDKVIYQFVLGSTTIGKMKKQTGIKTSAKINYLELDPVFQDGSECGFTPQGDVKLTQRQIDTGAIKINMELCDRDLLGTYAEYLVRVAATGATLPFEQEIIDLLTKKSAEKMEKAVWQGDTASDDTTLARFDGLLKIAGAETTVTKVTGSASAAYDAIEAVYDALPEELLDPSMKTSIFVSPDIFRKFTKELMDKNLYHHKGVQDGQNPSEIFFPGSDVKVVKTNGLAGSKKIFATYEGNLYYGCDLENAKEDVKVWFSDDDDKFKIKVLWNAGVQVAFPDLVVLSTLA